jgi:hypothetical protein
LNRLLNSLAEITLGVSVAELEGFVLSRRCATGDGGASKRAAFEHHIGFNGGIPAAVENLARLDFNYA